MRFFRCIVLLCLFLKLSLSAWCQDSHDATLPVSVSGSGVLVELVLKGSVAERAGLRDGDVLQDWERSGEKGSFKSPFDLSYVFLTQALRGPVIINASRGGQRKRWVFRSDGWNIEVRPNFSSGLLSIYQDAEDFLAQGKVNEGAERFRQAAVIASHSEAPWLGPWLLSHAGKRLAGSRQWSLCDGLYADAIKQSASTSPVVRAELFRQWAVTFEQRDELSRASDTYGQALQEYQKIGSGTMAESNALLTLAVVDLKRGEFEQAEEHLRKSLNIAELLAPASIQTLLAVANFAVLYQDEGQVEKAEEFYLRAIDDEEKHFPKSVQLANTLLELGILFYQEGDFQRANAYERKALAIAQQIDPNSLETAEVLFSLSACLVEQNDLVRAEQYERHSLAIRTKSASNGLLAAYNLAWLGRIARARGHLQEAEDYYHQSLTIAEKVNAPNLDRANFLMGLAAVMRDRRDYPNAEDLYGEALAIVEKQAPGSVDRVNIRGDLAGTLYSDSKNDAAARLYQQAIDILETRAAHLGGGQETRARYRADHAGYYEKYMALLVEENHAEQAFEILEASRARTLLEMLTQAHVEVEQAADPVLREREEKIQRLLTAKSEYRIRLLSAAHSDQQISEIDKDLDGLLLQHEQVREQLRLKSPAYASLTQPKKLTLSEIQGLLDRDTLLLEYSLGDDQSYLWAVTHSSIAVFPMVQRVQIETAARRVYDLLTRRSRKIEAEKSANQDDAEKDYLLAAARLSRMILAPAAHLLHGKRLLIVADGTLQYIPFAALPEPGRNPNSPPLVVGHEIVNLPSASVLAELRQQRVSRSRPPDIVAVLADPVFAPNDERLRVRQQNPLPSNQSAAEQNSDLTRSASDLGKTNFYLSRLLYTRNEANAVMAASQNGRSLMAVDFEASRALVTSGALRKYRIVHFATHGILNNRHPELSGLVLSLVNKQGKPQDGFLKLQDIYNLKLQADLVVLSGCQTGLGEQIDGEGIVGLTRGFMYAGASRVVASLWNVSDMATASLMKDFYQAMEHHGMRPAAALRAAQIKMWKEKQWSAPYYWAAFQIHGEWR